MRTVDTQNYEVEIQVRQKEVDSVVMLRQCRFVHKHTPLYKKKTLAHPRARWRDDRQESAGPQWMSITADQKKGRQIGDAYTQNLFALVVSL